MLWQVVRTVVAGGLMHGSEHLAAATTHSKPRQQNAALAPIRYASTCSSLLVLCSSLLLCISERNYREAVHFVYNCCLSHF